MFGREKRNEDYEEDEYDEYENDNIEQPNQQDEEGFEPPARDMTQVMEKVITPKTVEFGTISRDLRLSKTNYQDRLYLIRLATFIEILRRKVYGQAEKKSASFYHMIHGHYGNALASDDGFIAKNMMTSRQIISKEITKKKEKHGVLG